MRFHAAVLPILFAFALTAQTPPAAPLPEPIPIPADRLADSYAIYSQLMPGGEMNGWPADQWLLVGVTMLPLNTQVPCPAPDAPEQVREAAMEKARAAQWNNPRKDIQPPPDRKADFDRVLADFDQHFCERLQLGRLLQVPKPYQVLTPDEVREFAQTRSGYKPAGATAVAALEAAELKYKGAPGTSAFTEVYFNPEHTLAMVFTTQWCGLLCGTSAWEVLERVDGKWVSRPWVRTFTIS